MSNACCQGGDAESKGAESNFGRGRLFRRSGGAAAADATLSRGRRRLRFQLKDRREGQSSKKLPRGLSCLPGNRTINPRDKPGLETGRSSGFLSMGR